MPPVKEHDQIYPEDSGSKLTVATEKSEKTAASVHDTDYRKSLSLRNIHIEIVRRAQRILSRDRSSPELDDQTVEGMKRRLRKLRNANKEKLTWQFAYKLTSAMEDLPDDRLESTFNIIWSKAVHVPLDSPIFKQPLPLPRPKADVTFGYGESAFTHGQNRTMDLLEDDLDESYAAPVSNVRFPFLSVHVEAQAEGDTVNIALNHAAGAGAAAMNSHLELARRNGSIDDFDFSQPQFFSVTMDNYVVTVNVHWVSEPAKSGMHGFHLESLNHYVSSDPAGLRAIHKAVKNIMDEFAGTRLNTLCEAVDKYYEKVVSDQSKAKQQQEEAT